MEGDARKVWTAGCGTNGGVCVCVGGGAIPNMWVALTIGAPTEVVMVLGAEIDGRAGQPVWAGSSGWQSMGAKAPHPPSSVRESWWQQHFAHEQGHECRLRTSMRQRPSTLLPMAQPYH
eukprot:364639-Chlamydomonas_euryale.AAC.51